MFGLLIGFAGSVGWDVSVPILPKFGRRLFFNHQSDSFNFNSLCTTKDYLSRNLEYVDWKAFDQEGQTSLLSGLKLSGHGETSPP